ncbi:hypothetical protein EYF80_009855 [Liparis tanakae]|uniref:Uncharacterized protein n=1 Tax=Liparis tanakae TaxID=230148 RepID=A0A4Z2IQ58_9TELE|nr:hypothetical protein EYF80_009855 [Liparis tanakae]
MRLKGRFGPTPLPALAPEAADGREDGNLFVLSALGGDGGRRRSVTQLRVVCTLAGDSKKLSVECTLAEECLVPVSRVVSSAR